MQNKSTHTPYSIDLYSGIICVWFQSGVSIRNPRAQHGAVWESGSGECSALDLRTDVELDENMTASENLDIENEEVQS